MLKVIVPFYNCKKYLEKCFWSIANQTFQNIDVYFIDDMSDDNYLDLNIFDHKSFIKDDYKLIKNTEKKYQIRNYYDIIHKYCDDQDIIVLIDGDDWLFNEKVLETINICYKKYKELWILYTNFIDSSGREGFCDTILWHKNIREQPWVTSHLITFKAGLFKKIIKEDLMLDDKTWPSMSGDRFMMYPMIEMAGRKHVSFIKNMLYVYNVENELNDHKVDVRKQFNQCEIALKKPTYKLIDSI